MSDDIRGFFVNTDEEYMRRALALASNGRGRTSPNPMVGCVVVKAGVILSEGYHARAGEAHAEIQALDGLAAGACEGATVYVTLEPCCHTGKTGPCVERLITERPARVVAAMQDPNPLVRGEGFRRLREAGIAVDVGVLEAEARRLNEVFLKYVTTNLPFVIAKCAMTLDGKIATRTGDSRWVTGESARRHVHEMRNEVDAILVGSRTVMMDDPSLTTRLPGLDARDPVRVILDDGQYLDEDRKVFHVESRAPTWVVTGEPREYRLADDVLLVPEGPGGADMHALMALLGQRKIASVLIEGGGTTLASAFAAGIVDKVSFFVAPKIVGGHEAVTPVEGCGVDLMDDAVMLEEMTARAIGEDLLIEAYVKRSVGGPRESQALEDAWGVARLASTGDGAMSTEAPSVRG